MSACERCWSDAFVMSRMHGGAQADWYRLLLDQRENDPLCVPAVDPRYWKKDVAPSEDAP